MLCTSTTIGCCDRALNGSNGASLLLTEQVSGAALARGPGHRAGLFVAHRVCGSAPRAIAALRGVSSLDLRPQWFARCGRLSCGMGMPSRPQSAALEHSPFLALT